MYLSRERYPCWNDSISSSFVRSSAKSLTAAAHVLHLTQSALSHTVRKIEQQLGTPIWDREVAACGSRRAGSIC